MTASLETDIAASSRAPIQFVSRLSPAASLREAIRERSSAHSEDWFEPGTPPCCTPFAAVAMA